MLSYSTADVSSQTIIPSSSMLSYSTADVSSQTIIPSSSMLSYSEANTSSLIKPYNSTVSSIGSSVSSSTLNHNNLISSRNIAESTTYQNNTLSTQTTDSPTSIFFTTAMVNITTSTQNTDKQTTYSNITNLPTTVKNASYNTTNIPNTNISMLSTAKHITANSSSVDIDYTESTKQSMTSKINQIITTKQPTSNVEAPNLSLTSKKTTDETPITKKWWFLLSLSTGTITMFCLGVLTTAILLKSNANNNTEDNSVSDADTSV